MAAARSAGGAAGLVRGKRVLCVEDGPTCTHGGMPTGAACEMAKLCGASALVDPRPYAVGKLKETFATYPAIGPLLPAMGYSLCLFLLFVVVVIIV